MSVESDIGQKIKEAIDGHRMDAAHHGDQADSILDAWSEQDYEWLASAGVITKREAAIMLGVSPNRRKRTSRNPKGQRPDRLFNWGGWLRWVESHYRPGQTVTVVNGHGDAWSGASPVSGGQYRIKEILDFGGGRLDREARVEIVLDGGAALTIYMTGSDQIEDYIVPVGVSPNRRKRTSHNKKRTSRRAR